MPPAIPDKIPCEFIQQLDHELAALRDALSYEETEETWDRIAKALTRFGAVVKGGGYNFEKELVNAVKASAKPIISAMNSERTRLSAASLECITIIAPRIGLAFEPLVPLFVPHILRLCTRSNKVYVTRSQATLSLIVGYCHIPSIVPHLLVACKESKITTGRAVAAECALRCLNKWDWLQKDIKMKVGDIEGIIRITGRDKDAGIRQTSRKVFEAYKILFPERVDEFTGPLTPVMRKYLAIKPQAHTQKQVERARSPTAAEKPKRPPTRPDLAASTSAVPSAKSMETRAALGAHVRSASSNAVVEGSNASTGSSHAHAPRSMLPPAIIPCHARNISSRSQSQDRHQKEQSDHHERQRVISTASNHSTKSAPHNSQPDYEHRPPMRPASSRSPTARNNPVIPGSSGQARRVRKAIPVEPHPANRPDPMAVAHKAPVRPTPQSGTNAPRIVRLHTGLAREPRGVAQSAPPNAMGIIFPSSESVSTVPPERKGAQRVPKPVPPPPAPVSTPTSPSKIERPATSMGVVSKREVKPSIFRRGAPGAPGVGDKKKDEKKKEGFVPRRGGGVAQPTLSQLSKQKAANLNGPTVPAGTKAAARPAWGSGGTAKPVPARGLPTARGRGRGGSTRAPVVKHADQAQVKPAMVPLPPSPGREKDAVPQLVPLPESPKPAPTGGETPEAILPNPAPQEEEQHVEEAAEHAVEAASVADHEQEAVQSHTEEAAEVTQTEAPPSEANEDVFASHATLAPQVVEGAPADPEHHTARGQAEETAEIIQRPSEVSPEDVFVAQTAAPPCTPPFPSIDGDSDSEEDELEAIEFTTRDAYAPGGMPIKTPRKLGGVTVNGALPERNPLGEVVLNG